MTLLPLLRRSSPPLFAFLCLAALWQVAVDVRNISPLVLPAPSAIAGNLADNWSFYLDDAWVTLREASLGFVIAVVLSLVLAAIMTNSRLAHHAINPLQTALRSMPVVALAPALVMWLGFGDAPKVIIAAIITFPPLLVNAITGFGRVDPATLEVLSSVGASKREIFKELRVPHALPYLLSAAKVCVSLALVGAVVGEWAGSSEGLGYRIVRAQSDLETTTVWGATVALALLGIVLTLCVSLVERYALRNHPQSPSAN
jgi:NitT/TauT family transport system permease protein